MLSGLVITFRETLEAALIVGIILSYLTKTKQISLKKHVYLGIVIGAVASIIGAILFVTLAGGFEGKAEELFEGGTMLIGAGLLTTMILWMMNQNASEKLKEQVATKSRKKWGVFSLVFVSILREGIETVIFLYSARLVTGGGQIAGSVFGIFLALIVSYLLFKTTSRMPLKKFFIVSNIILILFAAGLVAHGVHELQEAGVVPIAVEHLYDINPLVNADGTYPVMHENGTIGSILKELIGYNGNPSFIEVMSYGIYLLIIGLVTFMIEPEKGKVK